MLNSKARLSIKRIAVLTLFIFLILGSLPGTFTYSSGLQLNQKIAHEMSIEGQQITDYTSHLIKLKAAEFDPLIEVPRFTKDISYSSENDYYIVQCTGPTQSYWIEDIEETGAIILGYIPDYAYIMCLRGDSKDKLKELSFIRWIGPFEPIYKIQDGLLEKEGEIELNVMVFEDEKNNIQNVRNRIMELGGIITYYNEDDQVARVKIDTAKIDDLTSIPEVEWVDEYTPPVMMMNIIRNFTGANYVHLNGFNGSGITGEVKEWGFDTSHPDFAGQIKGIDGGVADDAHGTSVLGIIFSSGANDENAKGMLPGGKAVFCHWNVDRVTSIHNLVTNWNGVFQSNSWHSGEIDSTYSYFSVKDDEAIAEYDVVMLYAAGNYGTEPYTCSQDAVAKNVIAVGALSHKNTVERTDDQWENKGWGATPSQGPAHDGRIKPDLSGPFDYIYTTDSVDGDGEDGYSVGNYTPDFGGTSGATPVTAGAVGLVYEMYKKNHFGNNPERNLPHASTVKAILIADAYQYGFSQANRYQQGWGGVDVKNVYDIGEDHFIVNETKAIKTGDSAAYAIEPTGNGPLKISLVWTDVPGEAPSSPNLVNNLNLRVTDPDGISYWGNRGLVNSKWSSTGGNDDSLNNVENVFIANPKNGTWLLEVIAQNIAQDGYSPTPTVYDQAFALVASNAVERLTIDITYPRSYELHNDIVTITGVATPDIVQVEVKIDNESWNPAIGTVDWSYDWDTHPFLDGNHTIYARGTNGTLYSEIKSKVVCLDNTPPITNLVTGNPKYFDGTIWYADDSTPFSFSSTDGEGIGVNSTQYKITYKGMLVKDWSDADVFTLSWGGGYYLIEYRSYDILENQEITKNSTVYVDSLPPITELIIGTPRYRNSSSDYFNVTTSTIFTIQVLEEQSIVEFPWYIIDGTYREAWSFNLMGYGEGMHIITWGCEDYFGNNESTDPISVILDRESPQTVLDIGEPKHQRYPHEPWNVTPSTIIDLIPTEEYSGVNFSWYFIDGQYFKGASFTLEDNYSDGPHTITFGSRDYVGHNESANTKLIILDSKAPETTYYLKGRQYRFSDKDNWNVTDDTIFELNANDDNAGVNFTWYTIDGAYIEDIQFTLEGEDEGPHTITWGSIDFLGQNEEIKSMTVNLDNEPPMTELKIGEPKYRKDDGDLWNVTSSTPFTLEFSDNYSSVARVWYEINGVYYGFDDISSEEISFNLSDFEDGHVKIEWGSVDNLDNPEESNSIIVHLNKLYPKTSYEIQGKKYRVSAINPWLITDKTNIILLPEIPASGIKETWYTVDGDYFTGISFTLSGFEEGLHDITWGSEDNLGINETGNFLQVILDFLPPETEIRISDPKYYEESQARWAVNSKTKFKLEPMDKQSGVALTWFLIDNVYFEGTSFSLSGYQDGRHTIAWGSKDFLDHNETVHSMALLMDNTPPSITLEIGKPKYIFSGNTIINSSTPITLILVDNSINRSTVYYSLDGGSIYQIYKSPFTVYPWTCTIKYYGEDILGNKAEEHEISVTVDNRDTDRDGIDDLTDFDDDNDGISDFLEDSNLNGIVDSGETNPKNPDTDGDGHLDSADSYPLDKGRWEDQENSSTSYLIIIFVVIIGLFLLFPFIVDLNKGKEEHEFRLEETGWKRQKEFGPVGEQTQWGEGSETESKPHEEQKEGEFTPQDYHDEETYEEEFLQLEDDREEITEEESEFQPEEEEAQFKPEEEEWGPEKEDETEFKSVEGELKEEEGDTEFTPSEEETEFKPEEDEETEFEPAEDEVEWSEEVGEEAEFEPAENGKERSRDEETEFIPEEGETEFLPEEDEETEFEPAEDEVEWSEEGEGDWEVGEEAEFEPAENEKEWSGDEETVFIAKEEETEFIPEEDEFKPDEDGVQLTEGKELEVKPKKKKSKRVKSDKKKGKRGRKK